MGTHNIKLKVTQTGAQSTTSAMNKVTGALKGVLGAYVGLQAIRKSVDFISNATVKFFRQSTVIARLNSLMKLTPDYTSETSKEMQTLAEKLQLVGVLGDDVTEAFMSQMASFKLSAENIKKLVPAAQDYIVATYGVNAGQEQAIQTANSLGKAYMGQAGMLARTGIIMSDVQKEMLKNGTQAEQTATLVNVLNDNYKGLNKELAKTPEGKKTSAMNAFGDAMEVVGEKFWKEGGLSDAMEGMKNFFSSEAGNDFAKSVGTSFGKVAVVLTNVLRLMNLIESKNQESLRKSTAKAKGQKGSIKSDEERIRELNDIIGTGGGNQKQIDERAKLRKDLPGKKEKLFQQNEQTIREADRVIDEAEQKLDKWWVKTAYFIKKTLDNAFVKPVEAGIAVYDASTYHYSDHLRKQDTAINKTVDTVNEVGSLNADGLAELNNTVNDLKIEVETIKNGK